MIKLFIAIIITCMSFSLYTGTHSGVSAILYNWMTPQKVETGSPEDNVLRIYEPDTSLKREIVDGTFIVLTHVVLDLFNESYLGPHWMLTESMVKISQYEIAKAKGKKEIYLRGSFYGNLFDMLDKGLFGGFVKELASGIPFVGEYAQFIVPNLLGHELIHPLFPKPIWQLSTEDTFNAEILSVFAMTILL